MSGKQPVIPHISNLYEVVTEEVVSVCKVDVPGVVVSNSSRKLEVAGVWGHVVELVNHLGGGA